MAEPVSLLEDKLHSSNNELANAFGTQEDSLLAQMLPSARLATEAAEVIEIEL
jgi:hypothetical protein